MPDIEQKFPKWNFTTTFINIALMVLWLGLATSFCIVTQAITENDNSAPLIFTMAIFLTALTTEGFYPGLAATALSLFLVSWIFTEPYFGVELQTPDYRISMTIFCMVGLSISYCVSLFKESWEYRQKTAVERVRSNLLRSISHDLRTPLAVILGDAEMALANEDKQENQYLLNDISNSAQWLVRMVENVLSVTRMDGQVGNITKTDELPEELIASVIAKFQRRYPEIEFSVKTPEEAVFVPMDYMLMEQLFMNLFDNAVTHGHATSIDIKFKSNGKKAKFAVTNNGEAISEKEINSMLDGDKVFSGPDNDSNKFIGIGLAVCKTVVRVHGGSIAARNTTDGVQFSFDITMEHGVKDGIKG